MSGSLEGKDVKLGPPDDWTEVRFPKAFVILGPTTVVGTVRLEVNAQRKHWAASVGAGSLPDGALSGTVTWTSWQVSQYCFG
jgi:hypothetical protein